MVRKNEDILELSVSNLTGCYVVIVSDIFWLHNKSAFAVHMANPVAMVEM